MTFGQMKLQVQQWLGLQDQTQTPEYDEVSIVSQLIYQGTLDLLARTRCVVSCVHLRTEADVFEYVLDHGILSLVDLEDGGRRRARRDQSSWCYPSFTLIRSDILHINPAPSEDGEVDVWAVMRPQPLVLDTDSPGVDPFGRIPDEFQDAIVTYALWKAADYTDDAGTQGGEYYRILYEGQDGRGGRLAQIRVAVNKRGTAKGPPRRVKLRATSPSGSYT